MSRKLKQGAAGQSANGSLIGAATGSEDALRERQSVLHPEVQQAQQAFGRCGTAVRALLALCATDKPDRLLQGIINHSVSTSQHDDRADPPPNSREGE